MQGTPLTRSVEVVTTADELQARNGQDHQRVYDPMVHSVLIEALEELKKMNRYFSIITGEEL